MDAVSCTMTEVDVIGIGDLISLEAETVNPQTSAQRFISGRMDGSLQAMEEDAIDLEDGGEVRVVGHQVNLQRTVDQKVAVSIPIAQLYCDIVTCRGSRQGACGLTVPLPPESEYSFAAVPSCWTMRPAL